MWTVTATRSFELPGELASIVTWVEGTLAVIRSFCADELAAFARAVAAVSRDENHVVIAVSAHADCLQCSVRGSGQNLLVYRPAGVS